MRVLVTNDDGIEAPGLHALATALHRADHDVIVVAPSGERSGSGAAIGRLHRAGPIAWQEVTWPDLDVPLHSVDLPPAAAVYAGCLGAFGPRPDVVASGVNPGLNYGHLALHSGTVGAALTAKVLGVPAVAVSIKFDDEQQWATAATLAAGAVGWVGDADEMRVVNLSVPNVPLADVRAAARTRPGELVLEYEGHAAEPPPGSDLALVREGWAAVTVLSGIEGVDGAASGLTDAVAGLLSPGAAA